MFLSTINVCNLIVCLNSSFSTLFLLITLQHLLQYALRVVLTFLIFCPRIVFCTIGCLDWSQYLININFVFLLIYRWNRLNGVAVLHFMFYLLVIFSIHSHVYLMYLIFKSSKLLHNHVLLNNRFFIFHLLSIDIWFSDSLFIILPLCFLSLNFPA